MDRQTQFEMMAVLLTTAVTICRVVALLALTTLIADWCWTIVSTP